MKNNKGFSLVELLVTIAVLAVIMAEVAGLMINTSTLYLNGTREVTLQTEAQLVIQQLEDLMIDADWGLSHTYDETIGSDRYIVISANEASRLTYTIEYKPSTNASVSFGSLYLTQTGGDDPCTDLILADYVQSISLNMANFEANDVVTIDLVMANEKYTYEASQDIFLRNMIGSNRSNRGTAHTSVSEREVEMNRFATLDLESVFYSDIYAFESEHTSDMFTYKFTWQPVEGTRLPSAIYSLNTWTNEVTCMTQVENPKNWDKSFPLNTDPECIIVCTAVSIKDDSETVLAKIRLVTPAVGVGLGLGSTDDGITSTSKYGYGLIFPSTENSSEYFSAVGFQGIDPGYCTAIDYKVTLERFNMPSSTYMDNLDSYDSDMVETILRSITYNSAGTSVLKTGTYTTGATASNPHFVNKKAVGDIDWSNITLPGSSQVFWIDQGVGANACKINNVGFESDAESNCILVYTDRMMDGDIGSYFKQTRQGFLLKMHLTLHFAGGRTLETDLFFSPTISSSDLSETYQENSLKIIYRMLEVLE